MLDLFLRNACQDLQPGGSVGGDGLHRQLLPPHLWHPGQSVEISEAVILHFSEAGFGSPLCLGGPWQRHACPCSQVDSYQKVFYMTMVKKVMNQRTKNAILGVG